MWGDFLCDPVMAAEIIFGIRLDAFQALRLRYYWWVQNVIDSSGVSSGKTIVDWLFLNLRCILIPDQEVAVYYPVFEQGKLTFWEYYSKIQSPLFRAQLGVPLLEQGEQKAGDGTAHGAGCYKAFYRSGGKVLMPAPSFMKDAVTQGSIRLNVLVVEEWTHVDASSDGINKQLIDRTSRPCWNQHHPIWGNHILFTAHAQTRRHPSYARYRNHQRRIERGDPTYANISFSYKDYSGLTSHTGKSFREEYRIEATIRNKRNVCSKVEWLGQGFGIWGLDGDGWFTEEAVNAAIESGRRRGVTPVLSAKMYEEGLSARSGEGAKN
jgi:hypothetical protein